MQRYFTKKKKDNLFYLSDDDLYHIKTVMRMQDGDLIEVVFENEVYQCCLESVKKNLKIIAQKKLKKLPQSTPKITLIIPLLKETKCDLIFQKATEMGADEFVVVPMNRCIIKLEGNKKATKIKRWERIVKEASEQSKRTNIPQIRLLSNLKELKKDGELNLICSTKEKEKNLKRVLTKNRNCDKINLVIGPEGGISEEEEAYLQSIGYESITLGNQILRVESVPLFLMSAIDYEYME